ncbi:unnamed protein product [Symbiodinium natans]|uniref:Uncharacterized protein n=1 Tax=Symbiodinium natans TaxID=878477 RepID=A0A812LC25_9DINO|nr:unnamed protein product [Symbiodinium natans]
MVQVRLPKGERSERPLRGVRGVFIHPVKDEHWEDKLHERLGLTGPDMLDKVLLRVQAQLEKLEGPSKVPIIVLDIPCKTREGMDSVSTFAKYQCSDEAMDATAVKTQQQRAEPSFSHDLSQSQKPEASSVKLFTHR